MSENTKWKPKTNKGSKMNKVELKRSMQKSKVYMWCYLFYLIPGAIFNDSDVTSIKPPFTSIIFFFLPRKSSKMENLQMK